MEKGERGRGREINGEILGESGEAGYGHLHGVAARLLGEALAPDDPVAAVRQLEVAARLFDEMQAHDELAKTLVAQAEVREATGDRFDARSLLERARAIFETVGTLDGPPRVLAALAALEAPGRA